MHALFQFEKTNGEASQRHTEVNCYSDWDFGHNSSVHGGKAGHRIPNGRFHEWNINWLIFGNVRVGHDKSIGQLKGSVSLDFLLPIFCKSSKVHCF